MIVIIPSISDRSARKAIAIILLFLGAMFLFAPTVVAISIIAEQVKPNFDESYIPFVLYAGIGAALVYTGIRVFNSARKAVDASSK
jgi:hypothetical protein